MDEPQVTPKKKSTRQLLAKIPNKPYLYRHSVNGSYYGRKKHAGKHKEHSLGTADRALAERRLRVWIADLESIDPANENSTFESLIERYQKTYAGKALKTVATRNSCAKRIRATWLGGTNVKLSTIKHSDLQGWLGLVEKDVGPAGFNLYGAFLKNVFKLAVADGVICTTTIIFPCDDD